MSFSSDGPCTDPDPIMWIHKACNNGNESLEIAEALKMCTYNVAWMSFDEKERGSLEKGKVADMVILSDNPYKMERENLKNLKVEKLLLSGKPYQKISQNPISQVVKGFLKK